MHIFQQIWVITWINLKNISDRVGASLVIVIGMAGVAAVLVALMALTKGFESSISGAGRDDRVFIFRGGVSLEFNGYISSEDAAIIVNKPGILKRKNAPLISGEQYIPIRFEVDEGESFSTIPLRGVSGESFDVREEVHIDAGRNFEFGKFEIIVGKLLAANKPEMEVGKILKIRDVEWEIVGHFTTNGSANESEIWADANLVTSVFKRYTPFGFLVAQLDSTANANAYDELDKALSEDKRLNTNLMRESTYYSLSSQSYSKLLKVMGIVLSFILGVGAVFAALNTMYAAVSSRVTEIGTLRAIGFGSTPIVFSVAVESLLLSLLGGVSGGLLAYILVNGHTISTTAGGTPVELSFSFQVTILSLFVASFLTCVLGLIGALFPALHATRQSITEALKRI